MVDRDGEQTYGKTSHAIQGQSDLESWREAEVAVAIRSREEVPQPHDHELYWYQPVAG